MLTQWIKFAFKNEYIASYDLNTTHDKALNNYRVVYSSNINTYIRSYVFRHINGALVLYVTMYI